MRTAAGLIMLFGGILIGIPLTMYFAASSLWGLLAIPWAGVVVAGGIYTLQRKHWKLCLAASILTAGIIPVIFVAVRKREWEGK